MTTGRDIVIIGAPRSGTNMLRDILTSRPGVVTWNCDEINAVWRHGSRQHPTDEIPVDRASPRMRRFVNDRFDAVRRRSRGHTVVEKTCANSLRVGYVAALLPDARFVLLTRDGIDVTASALSRWDAAIDWRYILRKARFVPPGDLGSSALDFARHRLSKRRTSERSLGTWGPRFEGIDEMTRRCSLEEVCAVQWQRCVELSHLALNALPSERTYRLSYEAFVGQPERELVRLLTFLELPVQEAALSVSGVTSTSVGLGRSILDQERLPLVERILLPTRQRLGYV
jgi:hypothetical protein